MDSKKLSKAAWLDLILNNAIYIILFALIIAIIAVDTTFITNLDNFKFIITQASTRLMLAIGVAGLLVLAGTDLSVGRMVGLAGVLSASLLQYADYSRRIFPDMAVLPVIVPVLLVIAICAVASTLNGIIIAKFKVTPFIATLGMQLVLYGATSLYYDAVGASPIAGLDPRFSNFAAGSFLGIPNLVIYAVLTTAVMWFVWNKTRLGKNMFAVGGNPEAAAVSGVSTIKTIIYVSLIAGMLYGFSGALEVARTGSATNNLGLGYELDAIAACVVGGVSFSGGVGTIAGVVTGTLIFQVINYGLAYINVSPYLQYIVKGLIIIIAVAIDTRKYIKKK